jgi:galactonate dehydratase
MKIQSIEAIPVRLARAEAGRRGTAGSPTPLVAATCDYRWSVVVPALYSIYFETALVKVTTDTGLTGWGEAQAPLAPEVACTIIHLLLSPVLLGRRFSGDPKEIEQCWELMYSTMRIRGQTGGFMLDAISGVDLALWDLAGKIRGQPVCELIAGRAKKKLVRAYLSGLAGATIEQKLKTAHQFWKQGFRHFKLFYEGEKSQLFATIDALRSKYRRDAHVAVDALWRLTPETAVAFGRELDERGVMWLEAPLLPEDPTAHRKLAAKIHTSLALGESYRTRYEIAPFLNPLVVSVLQPDVSRCGLTEALRIAKMLRQHSHLTRIAPHVSIALGPQIAAAIQYAAVCEECHLVEYNSRVFEIANCFLARPLSLDGAAYRVPAGPGLGVEILEDKLRAHMLPSRRN